MNAKTATTVTNTMLTHFNDMFESAEDREELLRTYVNEKNSQF